MEAPETAAMRLHGARLRATAIRCVVGEAPWLEPSQTDGFVLDEAEVTFWGLCPQCQDAEDGR